MYESHIKGETKLITFCFDEYGEFEKKNQPLLFIGGFMFDDNGNEKETENEKERITCFLKKVCQEAGTVFPKDLHVEKRLKNTNSNAVYNTKKVYISRFSEFIKRGTFNGEELINDKRNGNYSFLIEIAKDEKYDSNLNDWIADNKAANKYDNMVGDFIHNALFYNSEISSDTPIKLFFPTRAVIADGNLDDFNQKGYKRKDDSNLVFDTENAFFRSLISEISKKHTSRNVVIDGLDARSISNIYKLDENDNYQEIEDQAFLLLADVTCSVISNYFSNNYNYTGIESVFISEMGSLCQIYCYEKNEELFRKAYDSLIEKDILSVLKMVFCITQNRKDYYAIKWAPYILSVLENTVDSQCIKNALDKFNNTFDEYGNKEKDYIISWFSSKIESDESDILTFCNILTQKDFGDNVVEKIIEHIDDEDFFEAYKLIDSVENKYSNTENRIIADGLNILKEKIESNVDVDSFTKLVKELNEYTFKTRLPDELNYIFNRTMELYRKHKDTLGIDEQTAFLLYDTGVVLCNHSADTSRNKKFLSEIKKLRKYIDENEYDRRRNRYIVAYIDLLNFDDAFVISRENVIINGQKGRIKRIEIGDINFKSKDHAKALSQFAQICAFMNESNSSLVEKGILSEAKFENYKDFVEGLFEMALERFKKCSADYYITVNYLMHYYLSKIDELTFIKVFEDKEREFAGLEGKNLTKSEKRKFEKAKTVFENDRDFYEEQLAEKHNLIEKYNIYANIYFEGNNTPKEQFEYIMTLNKKSKVNPTYALFLWSKSLLKIYNSSDVKEIIGKEFFDDEINNRFRDSHPWELICLYLAEAYHVTGDGKKEKYYFDKAHIKNENELIKCLISNSKYHFYLFTNNNKAMAEKDNLEKILKEYTKGRFSKKDAGDVITYTYC